MLDLTAEPAIIAQALLGSRLITRLEGSEVTVRITETEAYAGEADPASHAYRGRSTRNQVMYGPSGHLYIYRSHGLHWCCNIVTGTDGDASAVLLRAGEVIEGKAAARERRGRDVPDRNLARGPGNLAQALGITDALYGVSLLDSEVVSIADALDPPTPISSGPRVGVTLAHEVPWRFWITGDPTVTTYRRSPRIPNPQS